MGRSTFSAELALWVVLAEEHLESINGGERGRERLQGCDRDKQFMGTTHDGLEFPSQRESQRSAERERERREEKLLQRPETKLRGKQEGGFV